MPSLQNSADLSAQDTLEKTKELQETLKIFEEDRINTFKNWPYDENQKCSITEVNNRMELNENKDQLIFKSIKL